MLVWVEPRAVGGRSEVQPDEGHAQRNHSSGGEQDSNTGAVALVHGGPHGCSAGWRQLKVVRRVPIIARKPAYDAPHDRHRERPAPRSRVPSGPWQTVCVAPVPAGSVKCTACPTLTVMLVVLKSAATILTSFGPVVRWPQAAKASSSTRARSARALLMRVFTAECPFVSVQQLT